MPILVAKGGRPGGIRNQPYVAQRKSTANDCVMKCIFDILGRSFSLNFFNDGLD